jgi:NADPH:quinone reductase-like Zn-dependent oxidoreductase
MVRPRRAPSSRVAGSPEDSKAQLIEAARFARGLDVPTGSVEDGKVTPAIGARHPLAEAAEAIRIRSGRHSLGKVVVAF